MIQAVDLVKSYGSGTNKQVVLKKVCLEIVPGDFTVILGASGSGKSTLLHILSGLERPDSGTVTYGGLDITKRTDPELTRFRRETVGFVFQQYYLLPHMTVAKNVRMGADLAGHRTYADIIRAVGLESKMDASPASLSGGEQQRVAIARALVNDPAVILADEATGNLDTRTSFEVLVLFQELHAAGRTIIFVTHNPEIAQYSSRNITLRDGRVTSDVVNGNILRAADALAQLPKQEE